MSATADLRLERRRQRLRQDRETILAAAEAVILRKGFSAATMDEIAREAQYSKATLYKIFPTKAELIRQILIHYMDLVRELADRAAASRRDPVSKLRAMVTAVLRFHQEKESLTRMLLLDTAALKAIHAAFSGPPAAGPAGPDDDAGGRRFLSDLRSHRRQALDKAAGVIREGIALGCFRDCDVDDVVELIGVLVEGCSHQDIWRTSPISPGRSADRLMDFILRGIGAARPGCTEGEPS